MSNENEPRKLNRRFEHYVGRNTTKVYDAGTSEYDLPSEARGLAERTGYFETLSGLDATSVVTEAVNTVANLSLDEDKRPSGSASDARISLNEPGLGAQPYSGPGTKLPDDVTAQASAGVTHAPVTQTSLAAPTTAQEEQQNVAQQTVGAVNQEPASQGENAPPAPAKDAVTANGDVSQPVNKPASGTVEDQQKASEADAPKAQGDAKDAGPATTDGKPAATGSKITLK